MSLTPRAQRALKLLESGWVCGQVFVEAGVGYAARVYELRGAGFEIALRRCANPLHRHRATMWEYGLEPGQIRLPVGDGP